MTYRHLLPRLEGYSVAQVFDFAVEYNKSRMVCCTQVNQYLRGIRACHQLQCARASLVNGAPLTVALV